MPLKGWVSGSVAVPLPHHEFRTMQVWVSLFAMVAAVSVAAIVFAAAVLPSGRRFWPVWCSAPWCRCGVTLLASLPAVAVSRDFVSLVTRIVEPSTDFGITQSVEVSGFIASTDRGTPIDLRRLSEAVAPGEVPEGYEGRMIVAGGAHALSNCHGWVFTDGEYCIDGASVDDIVRENGYEQVAEPIPSDLVIYRDADGVPVHTGIVKATGRNGFVLIESKWGQLDVYWHTPDDQRYADDWEYWRSPRPGHRIDVKVAP